MFLETHRHQLILDTGSPERATAVRTDHLEPDRLTISLDLHIIFPSEQQIFEFDTGGMGRMVGEPCDIDARIAQTLSKMGETALIDEPIDIAIPIAGIVGPRRVQVNDTPRLLPRPRPNDLLTDPGLVRRPWYLRAYLRHPR